MNPPLYKAGDLVVFWADTRNEWMDGPVVNWSIESGSGYWYKVEIKRYAGLPWGTWLVSEDCLRLKSKGSDRVSEWLE